MKMWPMVAVAVMSSACVWACQKDDPGSDGEGGQGGEGTGGTASGGASSGGASSGGAGSGGDGLGGGPSCEPDDVSVSWGGAGGMGGAGSEDIFGEWTDQYSSTYTITESSITTGYGAYDVVGIASAGQYIVTQNGEDNTYAPCLYSRFDWSVDDEGTYLCQTVYDADSVDAAVAVPAADRADLTSGCNGFPWSVLTPQ
jgi:hypothetical protein